MEHHKDNAEIVSKAKKMSSSRGWTKITAQPTNRSSAQIEGVSKKQDATYNHHTIRDGGRYGSHPSHDIYDDDSGA